MNISRDPNKLTSVLNFDVKSSMLEGNKTPESQSMSFGEILRKEADSFVNKFESPKPQETKSQNIDPNDSQINVKAVEIKEENPSQKTLEREEIINEASIREVDKEDNWKEEMEDKVSIEENELFFFDSIHSFLQKVPAETKTNLEDLPKSEKPTSTFALLKNNEKQAPYIHSTKESTNFIDDAKKLAETIFKKEKKEVKGKEMELPLESKTILEKSSTMKVESDDPKFIYQKGNITFANFNKAKVGSHSQDKTGKGSSLPSSISAQGKEIVRKENEISNVPQNTTKENQFTTPKENSNLREIPLKKKSTTPTNGISEENKTQFDLQSLSEKSVRQLGVKDKEFSKTDAKTNANVERLKSKDQVDQLTIANINSSPSKEENSQMSNGNKNSSSSREGFSFSSEIKHQNRNEELTKTEKTNLPSKQELQKNMDELVKQARFDIVQNGKSTAEIIMNPKEFGRLTLRVSVDGEKVEGRILVESEEMKELVSNEISKLRENLKDSGLSLESLLVDVWENADSNFSKHSADDRKFADDMRQASANRRSDIDTDENSLPENSDTLQRKNVLELFA